MKGSRPRILFISHSAGIGGATQSLLMLARYLKSDYEIGVVLPEQGIVCEWLEKEGVHPVVIPHLRADAIPQLYRLIRRGGFDLVYGNTPSSRSRNAMIAAKLARRPFVWHFRGILWHWNRRLGFFVRWADAVVAVSEACADSLARFYPRERIHVVYNGVEVAAFEGDRAAARAYLADQFDLPSGAHLIAAIAHVIPRKGHEQAIEVMSLLRRRLPAAHLLVAGRLDNDAYAGEIRALIRQWGVEDRVHLLGLRTDVPQILQGSDVLVHTAKEEAFGRVIIEGMAARLPVVAFSVDGVAEIVVDGVTGCLVPPGDVQAMADTLVSLLEAPGRAATMGAQGQERVTNRFSASATAAQICGIIESVVGD